MRNAAVLEAIADPDFQTELGQFNVEINIPPRLLGGRRCSAELETDVRDEPQRGRGARRARAGGAHGA